MVPHRVLSDGTAGAGFESCSGTALFFLSPQGLQRSSQISNPQIHTDFELNLIHCHFYSTCCAKISVGVFPHSPTPLHLEKMNISILSSHYGKTDPHLHNSTFPFSVLLHSCHSLALVPGILTKPHHTQCLITLLSILHPQIAFSFSVTPPYQSLASSVIIKPSSSKCCYWPPIIHPNMPQYLISLYPYKAWEQAS